MSLRFLIKSKMASLLSESDPVAFEPHCVAKATGLLLRHSAFFIPF